MDEKMKKLREEFAVLDKNGSGNISLTELKAAVEKKVAGNFQPEASTPDFQP
jgi:Ca2+-binding EF-hand superfamily protein